MTGGGVGFFCISNSFKASTRVPVDSLYAKIFRNRKLTRSALGAILIKSHVHRIVIRARCVLGGILTKNHSRVTSKKPIFTCINFFSTKIFLQTHETHNPLQRRSIEIAVCIFYTRLANI